MNLSRALRVESGAVVALIGSGGKTTTMMRLAEEISPTAAILLTTTTHLAGQEVEKVPNRLGTSQADWLLAALPRLKSGDPLLISGAIDPRDGKASGLSPRQWKELRAHLGDEPAITLVEADGARGLPLKAPLDDEPVIPEGSSLVVLVIGMSGLGELLGSGSVHRPARFADWAGARLGEVITPVQVAQALQHPGGYASKVPPGCRLVVFLNQAEEASRWSLAEELAKRLLQCATVDEVLIGSARSQDPIRVVQGRTAGVVLAAGGSRRMGEPKLLRPFRGQPLVVHAVDLAIRTTDEAIVILGAGQLWIRRALEGRPVRFVENALWEQGQSTSVRAAIQALGGGIQSVLFLLGDQPLIPDQLIRRLVERHQATLAPLVAPRVAGRQANPVLFDRATWPALLELQGDVGGRGLVAQYPPEWIEWGDEMAFLDVDTAEDYRRLLELE